MNFYVLKPDGMRFGKRWAYANAEEPTQFGEAPQCAKCGRYVGMLRWLPPHFISLSSSDSAKWGDILWGAGFQIMVSQRLAQQLASGNMQGVIKQYPAAHITKIGRSKQSIRNVPAYHLLEFLRYGAAIDDSASELMRDGKGCFRCSTAQSFSRIVLEAGSWAGADIFHIEGLPGEIIVSDHFRHIVEENRYTNIRLVNIDHYAYDVSRPGGWYDTSGRVQNLDAVY